MEPLERRRMLQLLGAGGLALAAGPALTGVAHARRPPAPACRGLHTRLTARYGLTAPIVGAGMGFYALPELVAAISNAGALGVLGAAPEPPPRLELLIRDVKARTSGLYGVDLVNTTLFGQGVPAVTDEHIDVLVGEQVPIVVFFWDVPPREWVQRLHRAGAEVWMQVGSVAGARQAVEAGVDLLIAQGSEAGGHQRGAAEGRPTPRAQLVPSIAQVCGHRPVLAAGGIAGGAALVDALVEGAEGAWVGTLFASSTESYAHDEYKRRVVAVRERDDAVVTTMFGPEWPGAPLQALRNRVVDEWAGREDEIPSPPPPPAVIGTTLFAGAPYEMPKFSVILPTRDTVGDFEEMCWPAGGVSASAIREVKPAARIVADLVAEACTLLQRRLDEPCDRAP